MVPELSADWAELADAQDKDLITIPDPEKSGACKDFLAGFVTGTEDGEAILQSWADNGLTVPGANKAALEAVTTGEKGILIAGVDYNAYSSMAKGEPLNIYYPASGTVVNPRPAMILKTAPNMDNAKLFVDYVLSEEAQTALSKTTIRGTMTSIAQDCPEMKPFEEINVVYEDQAAVAELQTEMLEKWTNLLTK